MSLPPCDCQYCSSRRTEAGAYDVVDQIEQPKEEPLPWALHPTCNCLRCVEARGYEAGSAADPRSVLDQIERARRDYLAKPEAERGLPPIRRVDPPYPEADRVTAQRALLKDEVERQVFKSFLDDRVTADRALLKDEVERRVFKNFLDEIRPATDRIGDAAARKAAPLFSGCINYFPDALLAVAALSKVGNDQHNPGKDLFWDRSKSGDELDALARHLVDAGTLDTDGVRHSAKVAWRALANLQKEIEKERG